MPEAATEEALLAAVDAEQMIVDGRQQIASMKAVESSLMSQALLAPSRMELTYNKVITRRNPVTQYIKARLYPAYVLQNVIFQQPVNGNAIFTIYCLSEYYVNLILPSEFKRIAPSPVKRMVKKSMN